MRLLFGYAAFALLPGPSEVLVLADDTANPKYIAADLLAQGEHGPKHHRLWLITTSGKILKAVEKEIARQLPSLSHREFIRSNLDENTWLIQAKTMDDAIKLTSNCFRAGSIAGGQSGPRREKTR